MMEEVATKTVEEKSTEQESATVPTWSFEPGHTEAEFKARHMMVTWVRGLFKNIEGKVEFDPNKPDSLAFNTTMDVASLWTGVQQRDDHLRSADFFDVENHPTMSFASTSSERVGSTAYRVTGKFTIRGITKEVVLDVDYLGSWQTPYRTEAGDQGPITRIGLRGTTRINRYDFGVDWNDDMLDGGLIVSKNVIITFDIQALDDAAMDRIESE